MNVKSSLVKTTVLVFGAALVMVGIVLLLPNVPSTAQADADASLNTIADSAQLAGQDLHKPEPASGMLSRPGYGGKGNKQPDKLLPSTQDPLRLSSIVTAYAISQYNLYDFNFVGFDPSDPGTLGTIKSHTEAYVPAGTFLRGDSNHMYVLDYANNKLLTIDTTTGGVITIGTSVPVTGEAWSGLSASVDGTGLYASSATPRCGNEPGSHPSSLYTLDPNSGTATRIGPVSNTRCLWSIAVSPRGSVIFGVDVGLDVGITRTENYLVAIDPRNGNARDTGVLDYSYDLPVSLAFERHSGVLYLASHLADSRTHLTRLDNIYSGSPSMIDVGTFPWNTNIRAMAFPIGDENWGGPPDKIAPANVITDVVANPMLSWQATGTSDIYGYCITTTATISSTVCSGGWLSAANTSVQLSGLASGQTYYWQVRATNTLSTTYGDDGNWWSFTTATNSLLPRCYLPLIRR
jgi:hypothetical protein